VYGHLVECGKEWIIRGHGVETIGEQRSGEQETLGWSTKAVRPTRKNRGRNKGATTNSEMKKELLITRGKEVEKKSRNRLRPNLSNAENHQKGVCTEGVQSGGPQRNTEKGVHIESGLSPAKWEKVCLEGFSTGGTKRAAARLRMNEGVGLSG